jgi:hypothetical protein
LTRITEYIDFKLSANASAAQAIKSYLGLGSITEDADFVNILTLPLSSWQAQTWAVPQAQNGFYKFCSALDRAALSLEAMMSNYASYAIKHIAALCQSQNQDDCFGTFDEKRYHGTSLDDKWRLWTWQYCSEWCAPNPRHIDPYQILKDTVNRGYFIGAAPKSSLVSKLLTVEYNSRICKYAFPPGKHTRMPDSPQIDLINTYGDFSLNSSRLAFIDGSVG